MKKLFIFFLILLCATLSNVFGEVINIQSDSKPLIVIVNGETVFNSSVNVKSEIIDESLLLIEPKSEVIEPESILCDDNPNWEEIANLTLRYPKPGGSYASLVYAIKLGESEAWINKSYEKCLSKRSRATIAALLIQHYCETGHKIIIEDCCTCNGAESKRHPGLGHQDGRTIDFTWDDLENDWKFLLLVFERCPNSYCLIHTKIKEKIKEIANPNDWLKYNIKLNVDDTSGHNHDLHGHLQLGWQTKVIL